MTPQYLLKPARLAGSPLLASQSDGRLVDLVRAGSEPAFDAIVARYRGALLRYCSGVVGRDRAEDAVQQTIVNAINAMHPDEKELNLKAWLFRIAHNVSLNTLRDKSLRDEELDPELGGSEQPEDALERRERVAGVLAAVQGLPERQRDAIVLRELEGRSYDEIADALGVGGGSVRALLNRARNSVRLAATAVTPVGLLMRIPPVTGTGGDGVAGQAGEGLAARVAELTAGAGAGALASKVAATALVTGAVAGGVALGPGSSEGERALRADRDTAREPAQADGGVRPPGDIDDSGGRGEDDDRDDDRSGPGDGDAEDREERDEDDAEDRSGPGERSGPGDGEEDDPDDEDRSGPGGGGSGPGDGDDDDDTIVDEDRSGPGDGGGDDTLVDDDRSGPGGGGSGEDGSGESGSGSGSGGSGSGSGSGTSGSGDDGSGSGSGSGVSGGSGSG